MVNCRQWDGLHTISGRRPVSQTELTSVSLSRTTTGISWSLMRTPPRTPRGTNLSGGFQTALTVPLWGVPGKKTRKGLLYSADFPVWDQVGTAWENFLTDLLPLPPLSGPGLRDCEGAGGLVRPHHGVREPHVQPSRQADLPEISCRGVQRRELDILDRMQRLEVSKEEGNI